MEDSSRHVIGYPVQNVNGCSCGGAPPPPAASGTAYHYVNPKPKPCLSWIDKHLTALMLSILIFVVALAILSAALDPHLPDFSIQSLSLSNYNSTTNHGVTATWKAEFQVSNPNTKATFSYGEMDSVVLYKDYALADTRIGPLELGVARNSSRVVDASYAMVDAYVDGKVADAMNAERRSGEVKFNVKVCGYVKFGNIWSSGILPSEKHIRVWCNDVALISASAGKMTGGPKTCKVRSVR